MLTLRPRHFGISAGTLLALVLVGCGPSKVSQCNELADVVNQTQTFMQEFESEIQNFSESATQVQSLDDIKAAASQYTAAVDKVVTDLDSLVEDLNAVQLNDETLTSFRSDYVEVVQGFSGALTQASDAMGLVVEVNSEEQLPASIEESQGKTMEAVDTIQNLSAKEETLISQVNTYCGATDGSTTDTPDTPATEEAPADSSGE